MQKIIFIIEKIKKIPKVPSSESAHRYRVHHQRTLSLLRWAKERERENGAGADDGNNLIDVVENKN